MDGGTKQSCGSRRLKLHWRLLVRSLDFGQNRLQSSMERGKGGGRTQIHDLKVCQTLKGSELEFPGTVGWGGAIPRMQKFRCSNWETPRPIRTSWPPNLHKNVSAKMSVF